MTMKHKYILCPCCNTKKIDYIGKEGDKNVFGCLKCNAVFKIIRREDNELTDDNDSWYTSEIVIEGLTKEERDIHVRDVNGCEYHKDVVCPECGCAYEVPSWYPHPFENELYTCGCGCEFLVNELPMYCSHTIIKSGKQNTKEE